MVPMLLMFVQNATSDSWVTLPEVRFIAPDVKLLEPWWWVPAVVIVTPLSVKVAKLSV